MTEFFDTNSEKVVASLIHLSILVVVWWAVVRAITRRFGDSQLIFRSRKAVSYVAAMLAIVGLAYIWIDALSDIGTFLGLMAAGLAIALGDVIKNVAGWIYILVRRPFRAGDRIEIGQDAGDVIDIRMLRFSLLEIRNWVDADQSTGRILHIPNGLLFTHPMANFTEGFPYLWHEIEATVTFESDWEEAARVLRSILDEYSADPEQGAMEQMERASTYYFLRYRHLTPTVYVRAVENGVRLSGRLLVTVRQRRSVDHELWSAILKAFAVEPSIQLAYPTTRFFQSSQTTPERAPEASEEA